MSQPRFAPAVLVGLHWAAATLMMAVPVASIAEEPSGLSFTRIYSDANGVSHFKVEKLDFKALGGTNGEASLNRPDQLMMHILNGAQGATFLRLRHGASEDWHKAPRMQYLIGIRGESEVTVSDGKKLRVKPGDVVLMADTTGKGHITTCVGTEDHVALIIPVPERPAPK
jgi:quercetin dioxygenase-like cupin family protein